MFVSTTKCGKSLKTVMIYLGIDVIKTHTLHFLLKNIPMKLVENEDEMNELAWLSMWAVEARYLGDWKEASLENACKAIEIAENIYEKVLRVINYEKDLK